MRNLMYYRQLAIALHKAKNPDFCEAKADCLDGEALELAIKDYFHKPLVLSPAGRCDVRIGSRNCEIKSGAGGLGALGKRLLHGSGLAIYVPVLLMDYPLTMQDGYVMERNAFLDALEAAGAIRSKDGSRVTIQTFWNKKANKPHGRLLDRMMAAFDEAEAEALCDFLEASKG